MPQIISIYNQFLSFFPAGSHWIVSLILAVVLVVAVFKVITRHFIWLILLVILLPASQPILKTLWSGISDLIKFLLTKR